jgi:hypothetical protein
MFGIDGSIEGFLIMLVQSTRKTCTKLLQGGGALSQLQYNLSSSICSMTIFSYRLSSFYSLHSLHCTEYM